MKNSHRFFRNKDCEYFPCHGGAADTDGFNCLFCFCPLYPLADKCGGIFKILDSGVKDCSGCVIPHTPEGYDYIIGKLGQT